VIVLSVFLIAAVVTIVDSIDLTVLTIYNYTKAFTPVIPRSGRLEVDPDIQLQLASLPDRDRIIEASGFFFNVNTVFGPFPFVCFGVPEGDRDYLLQRAGDRLALGRMPADGAPEVVVSEGIARNRTLKIGDVLASPTDEGELMTVPVPVRVVGILDGPTWLAFTSKSFSDNALPLAPHSLLVTSQSAAGQRAFGRLLYKTLDRKRVEVFSFDSLIAELRRSLAAMYLIMGLVNGTVIFVVSLMAGMLSNIYFTQRISEFAVLSAIGLRRSILVAHAVSETAILTAIGWTLGVIVNLSVMSALRGTVFEPRGMLIDPADHMAYLYTLPIPVSITLFAVGTIGLRLSQLDPVTIIERR
jgi:ABC-type lipoprotein release transport system permease subunit